MTLCIVNCIIPHAISNYKHWTQDATIIPLILLPNHTHHHNGLKQYIQGHSLTIQA